MRIIRAHVLTFVCSIERDVWNVSDASLPRERAGGTVSPERDHSDFSPPPLTRCEWLALSSPVMVSEMEWECGGICGSRGPYDRWEVGTRADVVRRGCMIANALIARGWIGARGVTPSVRWVYRIKKKKREKDCITKQWTEEVRHER